MKNQNVATFFIAIFFLIACTGCKDGFERSGSVFDRNTLTPIADVSIDIYMKTVKRDSLNEKVFSDQTGNFRISEKRPKSELFLFHKEGYINFVSSLKKPNDTIWLEKER